MEFADTDFQRWKHRYLQLIEITIDYSTDTYFPNRLKSSKNNELRSGSSKQSASNTEILPENYRNRLEQRLLARLIGCVEPQNADRRASELLEQFGTLSNLLHYVDHGQSDALLVDKKMHTLLNSVTAIAGYLGEIQTQSDTEPNSAASLKHYLYTNMAHLEFEEVRALLLDNRLQLASDIVIAQGTNVSVHTAVREIFRHALAQNSGAFILVHNHPSGNSRPSEADIEFTQQLVQTAEMLDIAFIDHLIIARDGCTSLRDAGLMSPL